MPVSKRLEWGERGREVRGGEGGGVWVKETCPYASRTLPGGFWALALLPLTSLPALILCDCTRYT